MRLFGSTTSPYTRKVRIVAHEKGLDAIELVLVSPFEDGDAARQLRHLNPLNKIPTLVTGDGRVIGDSRVICEYLDEVGSGPTLLSAIAAERVAQRARAAQAEGATDAAFNLVMEGRRPERERSAAWIERWSANIAAALQAADWTPAARFGLAEIGWLCALDYLSFRLPGRVPLPAAALAWREQWAGRPIVAETYPRD